MSDTPRLDLEILTLFPEMFDSFLAASLLGKAIEGGLISVHRTNPRDFAPGKHKSVDDTPYGGGPGMVMRPEPLALAIEDAEAKRGRAHRVFLSPSGRVFGAGEVDFEAAFEPRGDTGEVVERALRVEADSRQARQQRERLAPVEGERARRELELEEALARGSG